MSKVLKLDDGDHVLEGAHARVTLVEYGDYQCPYCGRAYGILKQLLAQHGDVIRFVFRNFPLVDAHPHALIAAKAAEAAAAQGKFWPMHDLLYENQQALTPPDLVRYASQLALDVPRFVSEVNHDAELPKIKSDFTSGNELGVNGTPSFFIDGKRWEQSWDLEPLTRGILAHQR
jgi:protein-disulfide isomerase